MPGGGERSGKCQILSHRRRKMAGLRLGNDWKVFVFNVLQSGM
jgi:hypothetical protein